MDLIDQNVKIFAYSSSDKKFIRENINKTFSGVYTDFWDLDKSDCSSKNCKTY